MILEMKIKLDKNWTENSNINFEQMYILRKICTQYGKKIRDYSRSQNVAWKIPEGVGRGIVNVNMCWYVPEEVSDRHPGTEVF